MKHNYVAIVVMVVMHMAIGFAWYGFLFADAWSMAVYNKTVVQMQQSAEVTVVPYVFNIISSILTCMYLSWLVQKTNADTFVQGLRVGLYAAIFLAVPVLATHYPFLGLKLILLAIDAGMSTVVIILTAAVLAVWRQRPSIN